VGSAAAAAPKTSIGATRAFDGPDRSIRHRSDARKIHRTPVKNLDRGPEVEVRLGRRVEEALELEAALGHEDLARQQIFEAAHDLVHRFPRRDVRDLGSNMISSLDVAVDLEITTITKKIAGTRRRRRAFRAVENRALLFAKVAGLLEGNHSLIDEDFCGWFFIGNFHGLLGEGLGLAPPRVEGALAEHLVLGFVVCFCCVFVVARLFFGSCRSLRVGRGCLARLRLPLAWR
jgi:hypothetical protein